MSPGEVSDADNRSLDGLCRKRRWVDGLPSGLRSSYLHLYQCVRGLGCEDAAVIERYVILYFDVCYLTSRPFPVPETCFGLRGLSRRACVCSETRRSSVSGRQRTICRTAVHTAQHSKGWMRQTDLTGLTKRTVFCDYRQGGLGAGHAPSADGHLADRRHGLLPRHELRRRLPPQGS